MISLAVRAKWGIIGLEGWWNCYQKFLLRARFKILFLGPTCVSPQSSQLALILIEMKKSLLSALYHTALFLALERLRNETQGYDSFYTETS